MSFTSILNKLKNNKEITFLFVFLIAIIVSSFIFDSKMFEGYSNYNLANPGKFPKSVDLPILTSSFPFTGRNQVNSNNYNDIWWHYPIFKVGSYAQITNNLKYRRNPDDGVCITADFCGALYKDNQLKTNISTPLPPAPSVTADSVRVGYYLTDSNLIPGQPLGPELPAF
jgi:hypothetical protein